MPITEIVRVLARGRATAGSFELLYDVTGAMLPDEQTVGWPAFWVRELRGDGVEAPELVATHGPFETEDEAIEFGEERGADWLVA